MPVRLTFHGAASTVTGSCFLVEHVGGRLLVDCGLFQGTKTVRELNYGSFPFAPPSIDLVLLTHAHIDHAGLLPKLRKQGFKGPIIATEPTIDLLRFMLPDSGHIQESEVLRLNRRNRQRGRPLVEPIYTERDAERCLEQARPCDYDIWLEPAPGVRARYHDAGHILGSASIELEVRGEDGAPVRLLFSGDLGPDETTFHAPPKGLPGMDVVVVESTYGDRDREDVTIEARRARLAQEIRDALAAGGNLLIPAFAVERSQELLYTILELMREGAIPEAQVFLDSPLAVRASEVFARHRDSLAETRDLRAVFADPRLHFTQSAEESKAINAVTSGAIILAASGMCEAGRIRHHLKHHLWRAESTVLFVGYQAPGTLGQLILAGEPSVRIEGEEVAVRARIRAIDSFSAHADQKELLRWVAGCLPVRGGLFLTHGEPGAMTAFRTVLAGSDVDPATVHLPALDQRFELRAGAAPRPLPGPSRLPPEAAALPADWHNAYARLLLDLGRRLKGLPDDGARLALLERLRQGLGG
jgi:metallo-beta-lactamase family protein